MLLPDLGTAPVARYGEVLRRFVSHNEQVKGLLGACDELLVATPDPERERARAWVRGARCLRMWRGASRWGRRDVAW